MQILSLSEAKMKLSGLVDRVQAMDEEIIITRNGSPAAVLISPADYPRKGERGVGVVWNRDSVSDVDVDSLFDIIVNGLKALYCYS